ncbi:MAG TPA: ABC transporter substrate-binding protein [Anaerolineales bacterium]|nr:ABC transporter substrate-binding protein [Anaerolineales bacterium]
MKHKLYFLLSSLVLISLLLTACGTSAATEPPSPTETEAPGATDAPTDTPTEVPTEAPTAATAAPTGPLTVLIDNDEGPITPANFNTFIGYWMIGWVYDPLYMRTPEYEPIPALATSATPSEDGLTWEITLREGVKWHDGEDFTVDDVIFSYNFQIAAGSAPQLEAIESMEANGDYGLTLTLNEPKPFFLNEGLAQTYIMPEHIWRDQTPVSGELSQFQGFIGTGAYKLVEVEPGQYYRFEANPDYYRGEPLVPEILAKIVTDQDQRFNQLRSGEADAVLSSVPPALAAEFESNEEFKLSEGSNFASFVFYTNGSREPFNDPAVRQAIAKAIDSRTLVDVVLLGQGVELPLNWYHPELPWAINVPHVFDPEAAAAELEAAGLVDSDGDGIREFNGENTDFEILCDINKSVEVRATELIVGWLADVGIGSHQVCQDLNATVAVIWPNFVALPEPDYDMMIWLWSSTPQAQRGFVRFLTNCDFSVIGSRNLTGICDEEWDALLEEFVSSPDPERIEELSTQLQERFAENLPFIPLMSANGIFAYRPASYDGWVYLKGTGIMTVWSFLPEEAQDIP